MDLISAFFMRNIVYVYFFYGLAFFAMGFVVYLESGRASEFRFARALRPLAAFGFVHGGHEWFEMFQIFAAHENGYTAGTVEELIGVGSLVLSFLCLLTFGTRLLPDAERQPVASRWQVVGIALVWLAGVAIVYGRFRPSLIDLLSAADVLARYSLGIPGALLAAWALLRERHDFHARGMSAYGQSLLWAALAFFVYGVLGQMFTRPSLVFPSQTINTAFFIRAFGIPVQLLRGLAAAAIAITLGGALRAFEAESRQRLARANKARIEAQAAALRTQEQMVRQLVNAQEGERQRIARELHDETGQKLTALAMGLAAVDTALANNAPQAGNLVRELREMADQAITELRNIMADLRPSQLDDLGLVPALRWYVQRYAARHPELTVDFTADRLAGRLPSQHETVLFRVGQEALNNVARHACATQVEVRLSQENGRVRLAIADNGVGFATTGTPRPDGGGWGLVGMRERAALVGGAVTVASEPGQGTRVVIEVPVK
ncbi:MAG: sensor histidine kinase [Chloroflexi bacterium]|nr:sensor histidine kinase [Chloroflexota bacterium]